MAARFGDEGGRIINISSVVTETPMPGSSVYTASKAAVESITRVIAMELGAKRVTVNTVAPGAVETDMFYETGSNNYSDYMVARTPLGRIGQPRDIAGVVAMLVLEDAGWVAGPVVQAGGGLRF